MPSSRAELYRRWYAYETDSHARTITSLRLAQGAYAATPAWGKAVDLLAHTSLPAQVLGLKDRGLLREGYWGDVVLFDADTVADTATYDNPKQYPQGIPYVLVNGQVVIDDGHHTGARPGRVAYGPGKRIDN